MQIEERVVGDVTILDLKGKITLGEGDEALKDKINSLVLQDRRRILLNLAEVPDIDSAGLGDVVRALYQYWKPGMEMPTFDDVAPDAGAAPAAATAAEGVSGPEAAYLSLVPSTLVDRSRAALAKWKAGH